MVSSEEWKPSQQKTSRSPLNMVKKKQQQAKNLLSINLTIHQHNFEKTSTNDNLALV